MKSGFYANRVRASRREREASDAPAEPAPAKRRCSPSWARLITGCGGPLKIVAYINDQIPIKRILDHLGLSPPGQEEPAPTPEVVRVPVDGEGREILAG
jgi:hypothetical protein